MSPLNFFFSRIKNPKFLVFSLTVKFCILLNHPYQSSLAFLAAGLHYSLPVIPEEGWTQQSS